jgi:hypothetical protein
MGCVGENPIPYSPVYRPTDSGGGGFENDEQCALMGEILRIYCNESTESTGLSTVTCSATSGRKGELPCGG